MIIVGESCEQINGSITGLLVSGGISPYIYTWNSSPSSLDISNLQAGLYELIVSDQYGCADTANFNIDSISGPQINTSLLSVYHEDCGQGNGYINGISINSGTAPYTYYWNDSVSNIDTNYLHQGIYSFTVIDNNGCEDSIIIAINDGNYHTVDFDYSPTDIIAGSNIQFEDLSMDTTVSWIWDFGDGHSSTIQDPQHIFSYPGYKTICLIAANQFNCFDTLCIEVQVAPQEIIIPNIFTPNGDQVNDLYFVQGINDRFKISILNRWGEIIFHANPYQNNWDGRTNSGIMLSEGTYFFVLTNEIENINHKGSFFLKR